VLVPNNDPQPNQPTIYEVDLLSRLLRPADSPGDGLPLSGIDDEPWCLSSHAALPPACRGDGNRSSPYAALMKAVYGERPPSRSFVTPRLCAQSISPRVVPAGPSALALIGDG